MLQQPPHPTLPVAPVVPGAIPLSRSVAAGMPELELLRISPRARAWLGDVWAHDFGAPSRRQAPATSETAAATLHPAALAAAVGVDRVLRFPTAAPAAAGEVAAAGYGPADEADGSGLGPALVVLSGMAVAVDAPPLPKRWALSEEGEQGAAEGGRAETTAPPPQVGVPTVDDDDDAVVTLHFVADVQRDLLSSVTGRLYCIPPVVRGVFHRGTSEGLTLTTLNAPPGVPASQLALLDSSSSAVSSFRLRSIAVSVLVRPAPSPPLRTRGDDGSLGHGCTAVGGGTVDTAVADRVVAIPRRRRRRPVALEEVADAAVRARIVRNRAAAARANAPHGGRDIRSSNRHC
ncbi:hypothetical protein MMPV_000476 [Pyropia vietnamensis]